MTLNVLRNNFVTVLPRYLLNVLIACFVNIFLLAVVFHNSPPVPKLAKLGPIRNGDCCYLICCLLSRGLNRMPCDISQIDLRCVVT